MTKPPPPPDLELSSSPGLQSCKINTVTRFRGALWSEQAGVCVTPQDADSHLLPPLPLANAVPATLLLAAAGQITREQRCWVCKGSSYLPARVNFPS